MNNLLKKMGRSCFYIEPDFHPAKILTEANVLIIPTGSLLGSEKSEYIKVLLEQFAAQGGTIICFGQLNSNAYNVLSIPQGESFNAYGWSQDSSCLRHSVYFESIHPEIKIIRDLITFAKNPHLAIPMFDLANNPTQTETPASRAKLVAYTPDRKTVLY